MLRGIQHNDFYIFWHGDHKDESARTLRRDTCGGASSAANRCGPSGLRAGAPPENGRGESADAARLSCGFWERECGEGPACTAKGEIVSDLFKSKLG